MEHSGSLEKLVTESRHLRDHLLRVEGQDSGPLGIAMQSFDRAEDIYQVPDADATVLAAAFQMAHDKALNSVDGYTLNEVLKGRSPHVHRTSFWGSALLTGLGVLLVMTAFFYSNWASRTTLAINEAEEFIEFDHFNSVMKLIELETFFDRIESDTADSDMEPQLIYMERLSNLNAHYQSEQVLPGKLNGLIREVNPISRDVRRWRVDYCRTEDKTTLPLIVRAVGIMKKCKVFPAVPVRQQLKSAGVRQEEQRAFLTQVQQLGAQEKATMRIAGRRILNEYNSSFYIVQSQTLILKEWLNVVYLWALPILYGALGSIVYCMWRVLNPNLSAVGGLYAVIRTAFAALAALTLSMLLVPSNILTVGVTLDRPLIYLLSFIFGYSIEAFVSTLNMLNTYLTHNLTPKPRKEIVHDPDPGQGP